MRRFTLTLSRFACLCRLLGGWISTLQTKMRAIVKRFWVTSKAKCLLWCGRKRKSLRSFCMDGWMLRHDGWYNESRRCKQNSRKQRRYALSRFTGLSQLLEWWVDMRQTKMRTVVTICWVAAEPKCLLRCGGKHRLLVDYCFPQRIDKLGSEDSSSSFAWLSGRWDGTLQTKTWAIVRRWVTAEANVCVDVEEKEKVWDHSIWTDEYHIVMGDTMNHGCAHTTPENRDGIAGILSSKKDRAISWVEADRSLCIYKFVLVATPDIQRLQ